MKWLTLTLFVALVGCAAEVKEDLAPVPPRPIVVTPPPPLKYPAAHKLAAREARNGAYSLLEWAQYMRGLFGPSSPAGRLRWDGLWDSFEISLRAHKDKMDALLDEMNKAPQSPPEPDELEKMPDPSDFEQEPF